ncbi:lipase family protein [Flavobacterium cerinum]|uniref:Lipase family protein n=1 Tax=Flavobacterium cerinum TaxID=2502784 RepID=A0ABY5IMD5_9FLAO|nr:lipase family protein [Flavobacterium cerinum]UUC43914.1 lipase family protein [Flavobacterium cerinum]
MSSLLQYSAVKISFRLLIAIFCCCLLFSCCKTPLPSRIQLCQVPSPRPEENFAAFIEPDEAVFMMHAVQTVYDQRPVLDGYHQIESLRFFSLLNNEKAIIDERLQIDIAKGNEKVWSYVYQSNSDPSDLIIAIRGTENIMDWIKDLEVSQVPFISFSGSEKEVKIEQGFYSVYKGLREALFHIIQQWNPSRLRITGHSMGGSIALLLTYDITLTTPGLTPILFTYGMPRSGDLNFTNEIKRIHDTNAARLTFIINSKDIVPELPSDLFGYYTIPFTNYIFCFDTGNSVENHIWYEPALKELFKH